MYFYIITPANETKTVKKSVTTGSHGYIWCQGKENEWEVPIGIEGIYESDGTIYLSENKEKVKAFKEAHEFFKERLSIFLKEQL